MRGCLSTSGRALRRTLGQPFTTITGFPFTYRMVGKTVLVTRVVPTPPRDQAPSERRMRRVRDMTSSPAAIDAMVTALIPSLARSLAEKFSVFRAYLQTY